MLCRAIQVSFGALPWLRMCHFLILLWQRLAKLLEMAMERHTIELKTLERCEHACNTFRTRCTHQKALLSLSNLCLEASVWHCLCVSSEVIKLTFCKENTSNNEWITSAGGSSNVLGWLMVLGLCVCALSKVPSKQMVILGQPLSNRCLNSSRKANSALII